MESVTQKSLGFTPTPLKRIRQSTKPLMNKLEQEWFDEMCAKWAGSYVFYPQSLRFKLGNGIWYKPDAVCFNWIQRMACWEIKGPFAFRGGFENLKVAASKYPQIAWYLAWKESGEWKEQLVLP